MADMPLTWKLGMDNVSSKTSLPKGAVVDALNVDIDRSGTLSRRSGFSPVLASPGVHDLWTSDSRGQGFAMVGGSLCRVSMPWASTSLYTPDVDAPFSYTDLNTDVIAGSRYELLSIASDLSVRRLGLEKPGKPGVSSGGSGGLDAGTYGVAISYTRGAEEGPLSQAGFATLTEGQGLSLTIPQPSESWPTAVRVYRTEANGDTLYRVQDIPLALPSYTLGVTPLGRQADNQYLDRMLPGDFVRYWRGLLWCVRGNVIYHSEHLRYGLIDPRFNFVQMASAIRVFEPVENGIYVGTKDGIFFLGGSGPKDFAVTKTGGRPPRKGSGLRFNAALLGGDAGNTGQYVAMWLASNGFVVGLPGGGLIEGQGKRIELGGSTNKSAIAVNGRRVVATAS